MYIRSLVPSPTREKPDLVREHSSHHTVSQFWFLEKRGGAGASCTLLRQTFDSVVYPTRNLELRSPLERAAYWSCRQRLNFLSSYVTWCKVGQATDAVKSQAGDVPVAKPGLRCVYGPWSRVQAKVRIVGCQSRVLRTALSRCWWLPRGEAESGWCTVPCLLNLQLLLDATTQSPAKWQVHVISKRGM